MCDCFHLAFPNWQAASSGTGAGRRLRGPEPGTEDESISDEPPAFTEEERPRPQGSSPVEEYPESEKYTDSDKEGATEHDSHHKSGSVKKSKLSGLGSMFEKCSTPKMSKLKEAHSPESGVIVKTAKDGCAEGLIYGGGGKEGLFIKEVVPESPASKSLKLKEGDQVLSATVYFDSMPYEDAVRILGHAHAYRVRLCLKRNQKSTETEPGIDSDTIPEEELDTPEMREQGKTKRHGDARISWPKFPSFGSGQKSRFTRSHSSSEADEQKKLELSPTTSDTESPIKSQDALKGKKRYKTKATVPTKRDHISSPEDQETDAPTTGQSSDDTDHTVDMQETPDVCVAKDLKGVEDSRAEQNDQTLTENVQHKVKISVKSIMKTADLIVPLGDQESPSGIKSPDEKRKNKEKSELKVKILGKDKKDAKTKSSPKRLKTLGASTETEDQSGKYDVFPSLESHKEPKGDQLTLDAEPQIISSESSTIVPQKSVKMSVPKVELDISDVTFLQKSQKKGEEKTRRGKDTKQKQETKTGPTYKQPKVDLSEIATERIIQEKNVNGEECTAKTEQITTEETGAIEDPYDRLSKHSLPKTKLPKREDIEIPGMEDKSMRTKDKVIKEPKTVFTGQNSNEIQAETVQLSIDVDSVKEAVSKLPGYKLPKVDTYGMPIPEEITVIDANAQRISVKTPTKVVDAKTKYETHFTKFDINASPEISKTMVKLPKITPADLTLAEEPLTETKVGLIKTEKDSKTKPKQSDKEIKTEMYKQDNITIPSQKSAQERAILQPQETDQTERTKAIAFDYEPVVKLSQKKSDKKSKEKITMPSVEMAKPDIKIPDIGIDLPKQLVSEQKKDTVKEERIILVPEVKTSKSGPKKTKGQTGEVISDFKMPELESIEYIDSEGGSPANKVDGVRLTSCEVTLDATKSKPEKSIPAIRGEVKDTEAEKHLIKLPRFETVTPDISINVPNAEVITDGAEMKTLERQGKDGTFKMPNLIISMPKEKGPKIDVSLSKKNADYKLPEVHDTDIALRSVDVSIPEQMIVIKKPELQTKSQQIEGELEGQGSKDKMPKTAMKMSNFKGHEFDLNLSTKDSQITLPEAKAEVKPLQAPEADVTLGGVDVSIPEQEMAIEEPELEMKPLQIEGDLHGQGSKVKKPKFAIKMPRIKGPKFDWRTSQKGLDVAPQETKAEVKLPEVQETDFTLGNIPVSIPEQKIYVEKPELESTTTEVRDMGKGIITEGVPAVNTEAPSIKCPSVDIKTTGTEHDEKGSKFRLPSLGFSVPQGKGHDTDSSSTKKDLDVALQETKAEVKLPEVPETDITLGNMPVFIPEQKIYVEKPELEIKPMQIEGGLHGQGSKVKKPKFAIKMPRIKWPEFDVSSSPNNSQITLPEAKAEVKPPQAPEADVTLGGVDVSIPEAEMVIEDPSAEVEAKAPEIKVATKDTKGSPSKWNMPTVKWPKFGGGTPSTTTEVPDMCEGIITEEDPAVNTEAPSIKCPSVDIKTTGTEHDEKGSKFRLPSLGFSVPQGKGHDTDSSSTKKDLDVALQETKAEVKLPEVPETDITLGNMPVFIPEQKIYVEKPELEIKPVQIEGDLHGQGSKVKKPKFAIKMPRIKWPEFDVSSSPNNSQITLPEAKAEVKPPQAPEADVTLGGVDVSIPEAEMVIEDPSAEVEAKAPEIKVATKDTKGSPSKWNMPTVKWPKFGGGTPSTTTEVPDMCEGIITEEDPAVNTEAPSIKCPSVDIKTTGTEHDEKGSKFRLPSLGFSVPQGKGHDTDSSSTKKDLDVALQETKAEVKLPEVPETDITLGNMPVSIPEQKIYVEKPELEIKPVQIEGDLHGQGSKVKKPKFAIKMPRIKWPEFDVSSSPNNSQITLPEAKAEVKPPQAPEADVTLGGVDVSIPEAEMVIEDPSVEVEAKAPEIKVATKDTKGSPSKWNMPTVKWPKFGGGTPSTTTEVPDMCEGIITEEDPAVNTEAPSIKCPSVDIKTTGTEHDEKGSKFRLPSLGFSVPQGKGHDTDSSSTKKDLDVALQETKAEVKLPEVPETDFTLGNIPVSIPEQKIYVEKPELEIKPVQIEGDLHGQGSKVKKPMFPIKIPRIKRLEFDVSSSPNNSQITLPEAKAEVKPPQAPEADVTLGGVDVSIPEAEMVIEDPSAEVEIKAPEIKVATKDTKGSPSKWNMPTVKWPKFGGGTPSTTTEVPDMGEGIITEEVPAVNTEAPSIKCPSVDIKTTGTEHDEKGSKFRLPSLGFSVAQGKEHDTDSSSTKKDLDVALQETKAEVKLPCAELKEPLAEVEAKAPEIKAEKKDTKGSPSKWNMPTMKWPKFGGGTPSTTTEVPDMGEGIITEEVPAVNTEAPSIKCPSVDIKTTGTEHDEKGSKFRLPNLGFSVPQGKEHDTDSSSTKKDLDVALQETKAEVKLPCAELKDPSAEVEAKAPEIKAEKKDTKGSPSKWNMPTVKWPKFGGGTPSTTTEVPDMGKSIITEEVPAVNTEAPSIKCPSVDIKTTATEHDEKGSKFNLPSLGFSVPQGKGQDIDSSSTKKDLDVALQETKAEVKLPCAELKEPLAEVEAKAPEIKAVKKDTKGSPSKLNMPTFKLPKFGRLNPQVKVHDVERADLNSPEVKAQVKLPDVELKESATPFSVSQAPPIEGDANLKKTSWTLPKLSFSKPIIKTSEGDVNLDAPKADVPDLSKAALLDSETPKTERDGVGRGSPSKFELRSIQMPDVTFGIPGLEDDSVFLETKSKEANIKQDIKSLERTAMSKPATLDSKTLKTERGGVGRGSPSKFELRPIQMPDVTFSIPGLEDDNVVLETKSKEDQLEKKVEAKEESKSTKSSLMPFGKRLNKTDVEIVDLPETEKKEAIIKQDIKSLERTAMSKPATLDSKTLKTERGGVGRGSPSKFELRPIQMPDVTFSIPGLEDDNVILETKSKENQLEKKVEAKGESKSTKSSLMSFDKLINTIGIEFPDLPETKKKEANKKDTTKSPERTGWFKFPESGLFSKSEPQKVSKKDDHKDKKSPGGEIGLEELSPSSSVQSSDAFADISSPRLESGKMHVIKSNIQVTPEAHHAKILTAVQVQSSGDLPLEPEAKTATSWTVEDSQSGKRTVVEKHLIGEISSEKSETVVTKQIPHRPIVESSEPISGETASSIQRLRDSVHSEKMRFFDGAEK